ncbi:UNVERIFIED_CONTAM: hypothetical protein PYX00_000790 [Menopon gallinae]|uniref:Uncharacterized protein n=1 Tax=Menopon gallinae TaxID=328185 RepID=A0AAW2IAI1_9NEOP
MVKKSCLSPEAGYLQLLIWDDFPTDPPESARNPYLRREKIAVALTHGSPYRLLTNVDHHRFDMPIEGHQQNFKVNGLCSFVSDDRSTTAGIQDPVLLWGCTGHFPQIKPASQHPVNSRRDSGAGYADMLLTGQWACGYGQEKLSQYGGWTSTAYHLRLIEICNR